MLQGNYLLAILVALALNLVPIYAVAEEGIASPNQQIEEDTEAACKNNLVLIIRTNSDKSACVTAETAQVLIRRKQARYPFETSQLIRVPFKLPADIKKKTIENISLGDWMSEAHFEIASSDSYALVWWMPNEFWQSLLFKVSGQGDLLNNILPDISILAISQADINLLGVSEYYSKEEIEKGLVIAFTDAKSKEQKIHLTQSIHPDLKRYLDAYKSGLVSSMGEIGENTYFYVLNNRSKENLLLLDPYQKGEINIQLKRRNKGVVIANIKTPLNSLFIPRKCPNGEDTHVSWEYCPWAGNVDEKNIMIANGQVSLTQSQTQFTSPSNVKRKPFSDIDVETASLDTTFQFVDKNLDTGLIIWMPGEVIISNLIRDSMFDDTLQEALFNDLLNTSLLIVRQGGEGFLGIRSFYSKEEIDKGMIITFTNLKGEKQRIYPAQNISPNLEMLIDQYKFFQSADLGSSGENTVVYVLNNKTEDSQRLLDPYQKGILNVQLKKRNGDYMTADVKMPLNALFVPRKCPKGKDAHVSWAYCPWSGEQPRY